MRPGKFGVFAALLLTATAFYFSSTFSRENPPGEKTSALNQPASKPTALTSPAKLALSPTLAGLPVQPTPATRPVSDTLHALLPELKEQPKDWREFQPDTVTIEPFPGKPITFTRAKTKDEGKYVTWIGRNSSIPGASLVGVSSASRYDAIMILPGMGQISVHVDPDGRAFMNEADPGSEGCSVAPVQANRTQAIADWSAAEIYNPVNDSAKETLKETVTALISSPVDVLFLYDTTTLTAAQQRSSDAVGYIDGYSKAVIESGNVVLAQSRVTTFQWRYLGAEAAPVFTQTDTLADDLTAISPGGAIYDWVSNRRYQRGADQIMFWHGSQTAPDNAGGIARYNRQTPATADRAISVTRWNYSYKSVIHELAHNFGCTHDRDNADSSGGNANHTSSDGDGYYNYGQLWYFRGSNNLQASTIMGYGNYVIPYYSNPEIFVEVTSVLSGLPNSSLSWGIQGLGVAINQPRAAYNAKVLQDNGPAMSQISEEISAPQIVTHPLSTNVGSGQIFSLSVVASGGGLSYQWTKNGASISGANQSSYSKSNVSSSDSGTYAVTVSNFAGAVTSNNATVSVTSPPSGGGGGGATSFWCLGFIGVLAVARRMLRCIQ